MLGEPTGKRHAEAVVRLAGAGRSVDPSGNAGTRTDKTLMRANAVSKLQRAKLVKRSLKNIVVDDQRLAIAAAGSEGGVLGYLKHLKYLVLRLSPVP
jgi:hypothetical protein